MRSKSIEEDGGYCQVVCLVTSTRRCHLFSSDLIYHDVTSLTSLILTHSNGEPCNSSLICYQGRLLSSDSKDVRSSFYWSMSVLIYLQLSIAIGGCWAHTVYLVLKAMPTTEGTCFDCILRVSLFHYLRLNLTFSLSDDTERKRRWRKGRNKEGKEGQYHPR